MKKIIFLLFFFAVSFTIFSQSLVLTDTLGNKISNASIVLQNTDADNLLVAHINVTNASGNDISVKVKKYQLDVIEGSSDVFCWFECYGPMVFVSPDPISITPGETITQFTGDYNYSGHLGTSKIGYTFFNEVDEADSVMVIVYFSVMPQYLSTITIDQIDTCFEFQQNSDTVNYAHIIESNVVDANNIDITWELFSPMTTYQLTTSYNWTDTGSVLVNLPLNCSSTKNLQTFKFIIMINYNDTSGNSISWTNYNHYNCEVFPNPADEVVNFAYDLKNNSNNSLIIYNTLGSVIKEIELDAFSSRLSLNISDWKSGIYFYSLFNNGKSKSIGKFIVK